MGQASGKFKECPDNGEAARIHLPLTRCIAEAFEGPQETGQCKQSSTDGGISNFNKADPWRRRRIICTQKPNSEHAINIDNDVDGLRESLKGKARGAL